jgi:hypothetical protein
MDVARMHKEMIMRDIYKGNLYAQPGVVYPYTEIHGYLDLRDADDKTSFPNLEVAGSFDAAGVKLQNPCPKLKVLGYSLFADGATLTLPELRVMDGDFFAQGKSKLSCPNLKMIGGMVYGDIDRSTAFPALKHENASPSVFRQAFFDLGYLYADCILSEIIAHRGNVYRVRIIGHETTSYVVTDGQGNYSHGKTLREAKADLRFKITKRDTTQFQGWSLAKRVSADDAIVAYRAITGACQEGVSHFLSTLDKTPKTITVQEIIDLTKGHYGHERFVAFFS